MSCFKSLARSCMKLIILLIILEERLFSFIWKRNLWSQDRKADQVPQPFNIKFNTLSFLFCYITKPFMLNPWDRCLVIQKASKVVSYRKFCLWVISCSLLSCEVPNNSIWNDMKWFCLGKSGRWEWRAELQDLPGHWLARLAHRGTWERWIVYLSNYGHLFNEIEDVYKRQVAKPYSGMI